MEEGVVKAVEDVSFQLHSNEVLGIVGETGSGKSVTVKSIMRLIKEPGKIVKGQVLLKDGTDVLKLSKKDLYKIRGKKLSMVFQDPMTSLNPLYTIGDQLIETIILHQNVSKSEAWEIAVKSLSLAGIPNPEERMKSYPFEYSGGMRQRVVIAIAISCNPEILIADEPTTALDVTIQAQIIELFKELQERLKTGLIFITHDLGVIAEIADRVMVMYGGKQMELGTAEDIFYKSYHPYTKMLLNCVPRVDMKKNELKPIPGQPPRMINIPPICPFYPRCPRKIDKCAQSLPEFKEIEPGHFVRCHNPVKRGD